MTYLTPLSEFGHYLLFSILAGKVVLQFVPEEKKPKIQLSKSIYLLCSLGIIVFTFFPILQVILFFKDSVGFLDATLSVLRDFQIGRAWIAISVLALLLWVIMYFEKDKILQALCLLFMIIAVGCASHVASIAFLPGLYSHSIHFLMVTIWVGVLLHIAWFSKDSNNWASFLKWFTPVASFSLFIVLASGFLLMGYVDPPKDYVNSWGVPYGRMLLIKHIGIIPIISFAFINGVLAKKSASLTSFDPRPWVRWESVLLLIVFFFTAVLGTMPPPHEVTLVEVPKNMPTWVEWLLAKHELVNWQVTLVPSITSIGIILVSILFLSLIIISFQKVKPIIAGLLAISFIITLYLGLMFSVVLNH